MFLTRCDQPFSRPSRRFRTVSAYVLSAVLVIFLFSESEPAGSQVDPGVMPVSIYGILDAAGERLGRILVARDPGLGFAGESEYWLVDEALLLDIADQESLELAVLAQGSWRDSQVLDALDWRPEGESVEWRHPTSVRWTDSSEARPPASQGGVYFGDPTVGGLTLQYSREGASLTWHKLTPGPYMLLGDRTVFRRSEAPETGHWWHGDL